MHAKTNKQSHIILVPLLIQFQFQVHNCGLCRFYFLRQSALCLLQLRFEGRDLVLEI